MKAAGRARVGAIAVGLALAAVPPVSNATGESTRAAVASSADAAPGGYWSRLAGGSQETAAQAWLAAGEAVARQRRPFATVATTAAAPSSASPVRVWRGVGFGGDFNGDRRSDVVELAQGVRYVDGVTVPAWFNVTAFHGRSGKRLWGSRVTLPGVRCLHRDCGYIYRAGYAYPTRVGRDNGVEIVVFSVASDNAAKSDPNDVTSWFRGSVIVAFDVITLDRQGRQAWARHFEGRFDVEWQRVKLTQVPVVQGAGHLEGGPSSDWVLTVSDGYLVDNSTTRMNVAQALRPTGIRPYVPNGHLFTSQAVVVDAGNGRVRNVGDAAVGPAAVRDLAPVGDLSGDGRDDLIETHPFASDWFHLNRDSAGDGIVTALRSTDGSGMWPQVVSATDTPSAVFDAGDVTGDRRGDVVLLMRAARDGAPPVVLLDGASGALKWEKAGYAALSIPTGRDGRSHVALATIAGTRGPAVKVASFDGQGAPRWAVELPVRVSDGEELVGAILRDAGDLDADRILDVDVSVVTRQPTLPPISSVYSVTEVGFSSGRTGRAIPRVAEEKAIHGSVDGRGDDAFTSGSTGVTVRSGATAKAIWRVGFGRRVMFAAAATDGMHDRCGNLLAWAYVTSDRGIYTVVAAMFSPAGRLLWTRQFGHPSPSRPHTVSRSLRC